MASEWNLWVWLECIGVVIVGFKGVVRTGLERDDGLQVSEMNL